MIKFDDLEGIPERLPTVAFGHEFTHIQNMFARWAHGVPRRRAKLFNPPHPRFVKSDAW
jgi:hypothetical protein